VRSQLLTPVHKRFPEKKVLQVSANVLHHAKEGVKLLNFKKMSYYEAYHCREYCQFVVNANTKRRKTTIT